MYSANTLIVRLYYELCSKCIAISNQYMYYCITVLLHTSWIGNFLFRFKVCVVRPFVGQRW